MNNFHNDEPRKTESNIVTNWIFDVARSEQTHLFFARSFLLLGFYTAADTYAPGSSPSEVENVKVMSCAEHLQEKAQAVSFDDVPEDCNKYEYDFGQKTVLSASGPSFAEYVVELPSRSTFIAAESKGFEYDAEARSDQIANIMGLIGLSSAIYGAVYMRRRLKEVDAISRIELYANNQE